MVDGCVIYEKGFAQSCAVAGQLAAFQLVLYIDVYFPPFSKGSRATVMGERRAVTRCVFFYIGHAAGMAVAFLRGCDGICVVSPVY